MSRRRAQCSRLTPNLKTLHLVGCTARACLQRGYPKTSNIHPSHLDHTTGGIINQPRQIHHPTWDLGPQFLRTQRQESVGVHLLSQPQGNRVLSEEYF